MLTAFLFVAGLVLLFVGAEIFVRGASRLAAAVGISPLVIGLTVVAFGTSAPELATSVSAARAGQAGADLALGNVVGSNIFNILLILGLSATIAPLVVAQGVVRRDVPVMVGISILLLLLALDGEITRTDGLLLAAGSVAYTFLAIRQGRRGGDSSAPGRVAEPARRGALAIVGTVLFALVGLAALVVGSRWFVSGAVAAARSLGISELVVGLTVVAAGTSLPEVATSVVATVRGERDIAVGNVVGSNIFNILAVLGVSSVVAPEGLRVTRTALVLDLPVMIAAAVACLPVFFTGLRIARWEGILFLGYYAVYVAFLVLSATGNPGLAGFRVVVLTFLLPLTLLTLLVTVWQHRMRRRSRSRP